MNTAGYEALRNSAAWIDLSGRGKIRVTGEDRARLLHAMTTNHVQQLVPGEGVYAFFLNAQGRIQADVNLFALKDQLLLDTEPEVKQKVYEHLDKFIIADDAYLADVTDDLATINIEGPGAQDVLNELGAQAPATEHGIAIWGNALVAAVTSTGSPGYSIFIPVSEKADLLVSLEKLEIPEADREAAEAVRLENGRPRYGTDFTDANIPQETQQMHALHFSKGCYLGQEIVERVRSRGHVNRVLVPLEIEAPEDVMTGKIEAGGKEVGTITSTAFSPSLNKVVAMGIVRAEALLAKDLTAAGYPALVKPSALPATTSKS
jgi:aminomethyltransferase